MLDGIPRISGIGSISVSGTKVTAKNSKGNGVITVCAKVGEETATMETLGVSVVEPTGVRQEKTTPNANNGWIAPVPNPDKKLYIPGQCSVAMCTVCYLSPTDVSFNKIQVGEGECKSIGTGSQFPSRHDILHLRTQPQCSVLAGNITQGCRINMAYDFISVRRNVTVASGTFKWDIHVGL